MNNRSIFSIHGITGMLIATLLLITILVVLTWLGIKAQRSVANKPYTIENANQIKMIDKNSASFKVIKE
ncbi:MAG: DUF4006 family protein [Sulfurospirillaceae bacterium]|jgi:hypothetical protein|nr:DUF4006 family protein [Sulfurospirillaceae bacterium]MCK9546348.1 DUF4006 family protein [Sulfurospirillaceae bacterium]MDY0237367.1 DUF4006 family protein [Campylobacterales bacterium]NLN00217.1 DUF4006 family protein [Campylobacteraceae bacterium]